MKELKFYIEQPSILKALFYLVTKRWDEFKRSVKISEILRKTMENSNLITKEKYDEITEITYPDVEIVMDEYNYYLRIHMLYGQTTNQWKNKEDAFSNALRCLLVNSKLEPGILEMTLEHTKMNADKVLYKKSDDHYINIGYAPGGIIKWKFDEEPHCLIIGETGSGKSTFVRNLLTQFRDDWILKVVDGKFVEFSFLRKYGFDVATTKDQFLDYVRDAKREMQKRYRELEKRELNNYNKAGFKPYFLLVDEFICLADMLSLMKQKENGNKTEKDLLFEDLKELSLKGRAAGVFLILILQRPDSTFMPTVIRENLVCKVVLRGSETGNEMALGSEHKKLPKLSQGQGYCLIHELSNFSFPNYEQEDFVLDLKERLGITEEESAKKVVKLVTRGDQDKEQQKKSQTV